MPDLEVLFDEFKDYIVEGFSTLLPFIVLFISIMLAFYIMNQLAFFIKKSIKGRVN